MENIVSKKNAKNKLAPVPIAMTILLDITLPAMRVPITMSLVS